jgi:hypothetical protein
MILIATGGDNAMTSTTAAGQRGFRHELLLYDSTAELLEFVVPMVRDGVAAQEPTLLLVRPKGLPMIDTLNRGAG